MSGYVLAFIGGIVFVLLFVGCWACWITRGMPDLTQQECPHCFGTGRKPKEPDFP